MTTRGTLPQLTAKYTSDQELVDNTATDGCMEFETHNGVNIRIPCNILQCVDYAFPTKIINLLTGFGTQTVDDRITAIEKFVKSGGDVNRENGVMLLTALGMTSDRSEDLVACLMENGARVYDKQNLYLLPHQSTTRSAMNVDTTVPKHRVALLKHVMTPGLYPSLINDIGEHNGNVRLQVFAEITDTDPEVEELLVSLISKCFSISRPHTTRNVFIPKNIRVQTRLLFEHGILYNVTPDITNAVHSAFLEHTAKITLLDQSVQQKLDRLEKIDAILAVAGSSNEVSVTDTVSQ